MQLAGSSKHRSPLPIGNPPVGYCARSLAQVTSVRILLLRGTKGRGGPAGATHPSHRTTHWQATRPRFPCCRSWGPRYTDTNCCTRLCLRTGAPPKPWWLRRRQLHTTTPSDGGRGGGGGVRPEGPPGKLRWGCLGPPALPGWLSDWVRTVEAVIQGVVAQRAAPGRRCACRSVCRAQEQKVGVHRTARLHASHRPHRENKFQLKLASATSTDHTYQLENGI